MATASKKGRSQLDAEAQGKQREGEQLRLRPAYMQALFAWRAKQGRVVYPDANGTLRISYGKVEALRPRDAVTYPPVSTVAGIVEKTPTKCRSTRPSRCWRRLPRAISAAPPTRC